MTRNSLLKSWIAGSAVLLGLWAFPAAAQQVGRGINVTVYESPT
jgi:hypothetical protein